MSRQVVEAESAMLGFKKLSNQVYLRDGEPGAQDPSHPSTVIIYGWGDARPKHVAKYVDGFQQLFPHARIVLIFSPILKALYQTLDSRSQTMIPVIDAIYPGLLENPNDPSAKDKTTKERVLLHVMSNTGGMNCAATMNAYTQRTGGQLFPHDMMVCDSTPGSTHFLPNVGPWSRALALGPSRFLPWPFVVTRALAAIFLACLHGFGWVLGATSAAEFSTGAVNDTRYSDNGAKRLYLYSKEDDIIHWEDIEQHAADARGKGWDVSAEMFEGTSHVGHMRAHPEQYWAVIAAAWNEATSSRAQQ
ncbi:hypothetical protein N0V88_007879 [Collariella sp. IMI 366227]|nr:hypothetical protein N0V88_007879 [Collariella sp. IMI 366227]